MSQIIPKETAMENTSPEQTCGRKPLLDGKMRKRRLADGKNVKSGLVERMVV